MIVIVCGYGKDWCKLGKYVEFALKTASDAKVRAIVFSGGDTTGESSGGPWEFKTEAETMEAVAKKKIFLTGMMMKILKEKKAYNTLTNMLFSKRMINKNEKIIVVCNKAHLWKVRMAAVKVFGLRAVRQQISFCSFSLTTGRIENLKILIKTIPEAVGYFFRPFGRQIEYLQWRMRTGRNEQKKYEEFCSEFRSTGELL